MPTSLTFDAHGDGIGAAWTVLRDNAARAGLDAPVPTCPGWTVRDLVAHQGMVHRWATSHVVGAPIDDTRSIESDGVAASDLLGWLDEGAKGLLAALAFAPDDLEAFFFLKDAPAPKLAWARRQCHETTIHAVDAMAAALGRPPRAEETWIRTPLAVDGVDELLTGFVPRRNETLRSETPRAVVVRSTDTGHAWLLEICEGPVVTTAFGPESADLPVPDGTATLSGTAVGLYLGLWNRGGDIVSEGRDFLDSWRQNMTVSWD